MGVLSLLAILLVAAFVVVQLVGCIGDVFFEVLLVDMSVTVQGRLFVMSERINLLSIGIFL